MKLNISVLCFFISSCSFFNDSALNAYKNKLKITPDNLAEKFQLQNLANENANVDQNTFVLGSEIIKIREILFAETNSAGFQKIIDGKILMIASLFESQTLPYQGAVSQSSTCISHNTKNPTISENDYQKSYEFQLMANKNFVFGTCIESQDIYKTHYLILFCKKTNLLFEIKHFYLKNETKNNIEFNCN